MLFCLFHCFGMRLCMFQQCAVGIEPRTPFKQCPANVPQGEENSAGKIVSAGMVVTRYYLVQEVVFIYAYSFNFLNEGNFNIL